MVYVFNYFFFYLIFFIIPALTLIVGMDLVYLFLVSSTKVVVDTTTALVVVLP